MAVAFVIMQLMAVSISMAQQQYENPSYRLAGGGWRRLMCGWRMAASMAYLFND
jgi:hypothetical protein